MLCFRGIHCLSVSLCLSLFLFSNQERLSGQDLMAPKRGGENLHGKIRNKPPHSKRVVCMRGSPHNKTYTFIIRVLVSVFVADDFLWPCSVPQSQTETQSVLILLDAVIVANVAIKEHLAPNTRYLPTFERRHTTISLSGEPRREGAQYRPAFDFKHRTSLFPVKALLGNNDLSHILEAQLAAWVNYGARGNLVVA